MNDSSRLEHGFRALRTRLIDRLVAHYRRQGISRRVSGADKITAVAERIIASQLYCLLVTQSEGEFPAARVLQPVSDGSFVFRLGTSVASRKVRQLRSDPHCLLVFTEHAKGAEVICECVAEFVGDPVQRRRTFLPNFKAFWPDGPEDPDFCAIRFDTRAIEVWDAKRGVAPDPFGLASARLTRTPEGWQQG